MSSAPGNDPGISKKNDPAKYCLNCEKCIRKTRSQAKSNPRKIGQTQADGYLKYLEANGKTKTKKEVVDGYICNPCYCKYQFKYKGQYDAELENRRKACSNPATPPSTSRNPGPIGSNEDPVSTDPSTDTSPQADDKIQDEELELPQPHEDTDDQFSASYDRNTSGGRHNS